MTDPLLDLDVRRTWVALIDAATGVATPCRTTDPDLWHADTIEDRRVAVALCAACPGTVHDLCRTYAATASEEHGVWASVDRQTRHRRTRKAVA